MPPVMLPKEIVATSSFLLTNYCNPETRRKFLLSHKTGSFAVCNTDLGCARDQYGKGGIRPRGCTYFLGIGHTFGKAINFPDIVIRNGIDFQNFAT